MSDAEHREREYLDAVARLVDQSWPAGFPREVDYRLGKVPVTDHLRHAARETPDKPCLIYYGFELTYAELDEASDRFAAYLASRGLERGDRVAVFLYNCPQFFIAFHGILKLACVHVPVNPMFKRQELRYELLDAEPRILITSDRLYPLVESVRDETCIEEVVVTRFADYLPDEPSLPLPSLLETPASVCPGALELSEVLRTHGPEFDRPKLRLDDIASINYTGGTTGMPKGCIHTQWDMLYSCSAYRISAFRPDEPPREAVGLSFVPSFWIAGQLTLIAPILTGSTVIYLARWNAATVLKAIEKYFKIMGLQ